MEIDLNNMIFRVEDLTVEKVMEEYGISESRRKMFPGLYKQFIEDFIPTREDLERKIDEASLKELCVRLPCRVLMHRWNPVHDFVDQFTRQGRIQRWTKEKTKKLLVKAVHRYKDICMYSERDIRMQREREWCERKKENLMRLAVWEYDKKQQERNQQPAEEQEEQQQFNSYQLHIDDGNNVDVEVDENADDNLGHNTNDLDDDVADDDEINTTGSEPMESLIINEDILTEEHLTAYASSNKIDFIEERIASTVINVEAMMADLHGTPVESTPSDILPIQPLSQSTALNLTDFQKNAVSPTKSNSLPTTQNTEELAGREYVEMVQQLNSNSEPVLVDYVNVNTESMNFADSTTTSQEMFSDECTPPYCEFNTHVSMTSTQSPTAK